MNPAMKRFVKTYQPIYDPIARANVTQIDREDLAVAIANGLTAAGAKNFKHDLFVLLASDPLCVCAGPGDDFEKPCPYDREIRVSMHLSTAVDGRSKAWKATKPVVRCVSCGSQRFGSRTAA